MESSKYVGEHTACPCNLRGRPRPNVIFDRMSEDLDPCMRGAAILREEAPFVIRHADCQQEETETAAMANGLPSAFEPLCCNGVQFSIRQSHFTLPPACPIDSPWDIEQTSARNLDEIGTSMNLDDFIPLDELLEASLQSLDSTCSDRTTIQVMSPVFTHLMPINWCLLMHSSSSKALTATPGFSVTSSITAIYPPSLPAAKPSSRMQKRCLPE